MQRPTNRMARHLANRDPAPAAAPEIPPETPPKRKTPTVAVPLQSAVVQQSVRLSLCPGCASKIEFRTTGTRDGLRYVQCPRCHGRFVIDPAAGTIREVNERTRDGADK